MLEFLKYVYLIKRCFNIYKIIKKQYNVSKQKWKKIKPKNFGSEVNIKDKQIEKLYIFLLQKSFFLIWGNTVRLITYLLT